MSDSWIRCKRPQMVHFRSFVDAIERGQNWLHCDGVGGPESWSAIMYWAPSNVVLLQLNVLQIILAMMEAHDLPCCDGVVSITGREKENSGESWWRLLVVLLLLFPLCVWPTTSHNHLTNLGGDTRMKWNKSEKSKQKSNFAEIPWSFFVTPLSDIFEIFGCWFSHLMLDVPLKSLPRLYRKMIIKGLLKYA